MTRNPVSTPARTASELKDEGRVTSALIPPALLAERTNAAVVTVTPLTTPRCLAKATILDAVPTFFGKD